MKQLLSHQATILPVSNVENSIIYYTTKLGFTCSFKWEIPASYAVLKRDGITINLTLEEKIKDLENASICIFCHDVITVYEEYLKKGVAFAEQLNSTDYSMNEFVIVDIDNNKIIFGQGKDDS
ncbi:hypothetical protein MTsPCn9_16070 [Croceitalea sp. MTPC9]|uniref:VOC family protein n=1 Tax=unclassified Croceitalea TaxID=2632280 RepID=UPI002B3BCFED|nr:hypothetical protein MTsPCn6_08920 [Croceitalea sp. MTPC6]GMN16671.1 hypothetical protein MTsPCn9_16070 [Croceitalea sp. MTPC9]